MAADISFYAGLASVQNLQGSGLGFYGDSGFGASVAVGAYQGRTFVTNSNGNTNGWEANNIKYLNSGSGIIGQTGSGVGVANIPNSLATLNIRFTYDSAVKVQNAKCYFYDRVSINNNPSGVTVKAIEIIHPSLSQLEVGSGDTTWVTPAGTGITLDLAPSPGVSGFYAGNGANSQWYDTRHDWFVGISASPNSIASKTFALWCSLEYL